MIYDVSLKILIVLTTILITEDLPVIKEIIKKFTEEDDDDDGN